MGATMARRRMDEKALAAKQKAKKEQTEIPEKTQPPKSQKKVK